MLRRNFPDILKSIDVSPVDLYRNLVKVFFEERVEVFDGEYSFVAYSLYDWCKKEFRQFPYKCFTVSIEEFNDKTHLNHLRNIPYNDDVATDSLITLCEYILNFLSTIRFPKELIEEHDLTLELINVILDELHFMKTQDEKGIFMIVSANPAIIMVSSMVEEDIAIQLIKYTHHSM